MSRNSQGLYTLPLPPVRPGELVESAWANTSLDDIASALTGSLPRDGSAPMVGPLTLSNDPITASRQAASKAYVDQFMAYATGMPLASITPMAGTVVPPGFLICDGAAVSRTTYAALFGAISTTYGSGDGSTTFNVPDMRDQFIRGKSDARTVGSTQAAAFASHAHPVSDPTHTHTQAAHSHTISTGGHSHAVTDPGHAHSMVVGAFQGGNEHNSGSGNLPINPTTTGASGTGISVQAVGDLGGSTNAQTPVINAAAVNITVGTIGGDETRPQNIAMIYVIKALNDTAGVGVVTGITTSDANMISVDNANPVVPDLVIHSNIAFGIPKLDSQAKISLSQLPAGVQSFLGTYDASGGQNPSEQFPGNVYLDGDTYLVSAQGTINVYDPNTNTSAATQVELGWNLIYLNNGSQPVGWYYIEAPVVTAAIASQVAFTPEGTISATNVQDALAELDSETQASLATKAALGNAIPGMNGTASAGVASSASRTDHIHPTDTTRAPSAASTAAGTSFAPQGGIAATTVQGALVELDTEKATVASPALTGTPTAPTATPGTNTTQLATTAFVQAAGNGPAFSALPNVQSATGNFILTSYVEEFDTNNCFDPATGKFQPMVAGYYQFNGAVQINEASVSFRAYLTKNQIDIWYGSATGVGAVAESVNALIYCNGTTDYIQMGVAATLGWSTFFGAGISYFQGFMARGA